MNEPRQRSKAGPEAEIGPADTHDDRAILDINQITGFFAWCNRTIDGLGVQLEEYWAVADPSKSGPSSGGS